MEEIKRNNLVHLINKVYNLASILTLICLLFNPIPAHSLPSCTSVENEYNSWAGPHCKYSFTYITGGIETWYDCDYSYTVLNTITDNLVEFSYYEYAIHDWYNSHRTFLYCDGHTEEAQMPYAVHCVPGEGSDTLEICYSGSKALGAAIIYATYDCSNALHTSYI